MPETSPPPAEGSSGGPSTIERLVSSTERLIQSGECPRCHDKLTPNAVRCPTCKVRMQEIRAMAKQGRWPLPVRRKTPEEVRTAKRQPLGLLLGSFAASVAAAIIVVLAIQRFQSPLGKPDPTLQGALETARNAGLVTSLLFGLSTVVLYRGTGRLLMVLPLLGTVTACAPPLFLFVFSLGFVDCLHSCVPPAPSDLLWPAFFLQIAAVVLGGASIRPASSVSSLVPAT